MTALFLGLISCFAHAVPARDAVARLFAVRANGVESHVLANLDIYRLPPGADVGALRRAVRASCEFVLLNDPRQPPLKVKIPDHLRFRGRLALIDALSADSIRTVEYLVRRTPEHLEHYLSMRPGVALEHLKALFVTERQSALDAYHRALLAGETSPAARLDGRLVEAAADLWGDHVTTLGLLTTAYHYVLEHAGPGATGPSLDRFVIAAARDPRVTTLASADRVLAELDLVTDADLERFLRSVRDALDTLSADTFWDSVLIAMLDEELVRRYVALPTARVSRLFRLIHEDRPALNELMPGEEAKRRARANAHEDWMPILLEKIAAGGAFVSLGAGHVLPGLDPLVDRTVLDQLRAAGFAVAPVRWTP